MSIEINNVSSKNTTSFLEKLKILKYTFDFDKLTSTFDSYGLAHTLLHMLYLIYPNCIKNHANVIKFKEGFKKGIGKVITDDEADKLMGIINILMDLGDFDPASRKSISLGYAEAVAIRTQPYVPASIASIAKPASRVEDQCACLTKGGRGKRCKNPKQMGEFCNIHQTRCYKRYNSAGGRRTRKRR
jgi:hypothetical protein